LIKVNRHDRAILAAMAPFVFRCPNTSQSVQGWSADEVTEHGETYVPVQCIACRQFHFVNPLTAKVLGNTDDDE
jgi:hypothetical protein